MLELRWEGMEDCLAILRDLPPRLAERALKPAIDKSARIVARAMKANITRRRTGLLKASIGVKVRSKFTRATVYGLIGPRRDVQSFVVNRLGGRLQQTARWRRRRDLKRPGQASIKPSRYAHLVHMGIAGKRAVAPDPFMTLARQLTAAEVRQVQEREIRAGLSKILFRAV